MKKKLLMMSLVLMSAFSANAANMVLPCSQDKVFYYHRLVTFNTILTTSENGKIVNVLHRQSNEDTGAARDLLICNMKRQDLINKGYQSYGPPSEQVVEVHAD